MAAVAKKLGDATVRLGNNVQKWAVNTTVNKVIPKSKIFLRYARVELAPPGPSEFGTVSAQANTLISAAKNGNWRNVSVKQALVNTAIGVEVLCWFFVGEVIGKGSLIGYGNVPGSFKIH